MNNRKIIEDMRDDLAIAVRCLKKAEEKVNQLQSANILPEEITSVRQELNKIDIDSLICAQLEIDLYLLDQTQKKRQSIKEEYEKSKVWLDKCLKKAREKGDAKAMAFFVMMQELSNAVDRMDKE